jgi:multicomponent Na+:H+ antiporter subunit F
MTEIFFVIIGAGIFLCILRMILGPTSSDRAVALDTLSTVTTALLALVYAVLTFIGSVAVARFLERGI